MEDDILLELIQKNGANKWAVLARMLNSKIQNHADQESEYYIQRNGKQCRERWLNALDPSINKG